MLPLLVLLLQERFKVTSSQFFRTDDYKLYHAFNRVIQKKSVYEKIEETDNRWFQSIHE